LDEYLRLYLEFLQEQHPLLALVMIGIGGLFLTHGWKLFKILIAADAVLLGLLIGNIVGIHLNRPHMDIILGIGFGIVFAALVWPLMKWAVCLMGALFGAVVGLVLWRCAAQAAGYHALAEHAWAGGLIGLITMALLAFIIFRTVAVVVTSLQGAWLLVSGIGVLVLAIDGLRENVLARLNENPILIPVLTLIPGILGIIYQESKFLSLMAKKRQAAMAKG
jgi:hypothetical protein